MPKYSTALCVYQIPAHCHMQYYWTLWRTPASALLAGMRSFLCSNHSRRIRNGNVLTDAVKEDIEADGQQILWRKDEQGWFCALRIWIACASCNNSLSAKADRHSSLRTRKTYRSDRLSTRKCRWQAFHWEAAGIECPTRNICARVGLFFCTRHFSVNSILAFCERSKQSWPQHPNLYMNAFLHYSITVWI